MSDQHNWYESFFDGLAMEFWQEAMKPEYTDVEIKFILDILNLSTGAKILDIPCGFGRHSMALAHKGDRKSVV